MIVPLNIHLKRVFHRSRRLDTAGAYYWQTEHFSVFVLFWVNQINFQKALRVWHRERPNLFGRGGSWT